MISSENRALLEAISIQLHVNYDDLYKLINFESKWNPEAKNTRSSARGILQWTDSSAVSLGFKDSSDLVGKNPSVREQLPIVKRYLEQYKPFSNKQELYLSVFYPKMRKAAPDGIFPSHVRNANPGIVTIRDYVNHVEGTVMKSLAGVALAAAGFFLSFIYWVGGNAL